LASAAQLCAEPGAVAGTVFGVLGGGDGAPELGFKFVGPGHLRGRKKSTCGAISLDEFGVVNRSNRFGKADGMDFVARLQDLLFEIEENFGEAGLLFGKSEDRFIDDLKSEGGAYALATRVADAELDARIVAGLVDRPIGGGFDLELI